MSQFNELSQGVKFLVDLRAELMIFAAEDIRLQELDADIHALLTSWFDIGFLDLQRITWDTPAALLEKLIEYEAVHAIRSWDDLKNRLGDDRRCYAYFHPRMPDEPLILVQVALVKGMSDNIQGLLDEDAPPGDPEDADTAIFYSISNCHLGLAGVSFGEFPHQTRGGRSGGPVNRHGIQVSKGTWVTVGTPTGGDRCRSRRLISWTNEPALSRTLTVVCTVSLGSASNTGSAARPATNGWTAGERTVPEGLRNRSSRPMHCPWATPPEVVEAILGVRRTYTDYGAKKIRWYLEKYRAELVLPSRTTIHNILCRHDLVPKRRRRTRRWHPGRPGTVADVPNRSWSADFKGEFRTRDGRYCYPLTVQDMHSRSARLSRARRRQH